MTKKSDQGKVVKNDTELTAHAPDSRSMPHSFTKQGYFEVFYTWGPAPGIESTAETNINMVFLLWSS